MKALPRLRSALQNGPSALLIMVLLALILVHGPEPRVLVLARSFLWTGMLLCVVLLIWAGLLRRYWYLSAFLICALVCRSGITHDPGARVAHVHGEPVLRLVQINLLQENRKHQAVVERALATGADAISFQEVDPIWAAALDAGFGESYPYRRTVAGTDRYGIALYSRLPFTSATIFDLVGRPAVDATVATTWGDVRILCAHTSSPGSSKSYHDRNLQLQQLGERSAHGTAPTVVIGDLNTVNWDPAMKRFVEETGMGSDPRGPYRTWPTILGQALIPLDHILVTPTMGFVRSYVFKVPGSDHRGLCVELAPVVPLP